MDLNVKDIIELGATAVIFAIFIVGAFFMFKKLFPELLTLFKSVPELKSAVEKSGKDTIQAFNDVEEKRIEREREKDKHIQQHWDAITKAVEDGFGAIENRFEDVDRNHKMLEANHNLLKKDYEGWKADQKQENQNIHRRINQLENEQHNNNRKN